MTPQVLQSITGINADVGAFVATGVDCAGDAPEELPLSKRR